MGKAIANRHRPSLLPSPLLSPRSGPETITARQSSVLRLSFPSLGAIDSVCCGRVEDRPLPTTTRDMIIPVLLAFTANAGALQIRPATTRPVDLRNARLSKTRHLRRVPSVAGESIRLTVHAMRQACPLLLRLVSVPFLVAKISSTSL